MTTVFPGSIDSLPRPTPTTKTNAGGGLNLSTVIDNLSDAVEAIEAELIRRRHTEIIINGNYDHFQRGTGSRTHTTTYNVDTSYSADRFYTLPAGASVVGAQSATVPDSRSWLTQLVTGAASVTTVDHGQRVEGFYSNTHLMQSLVFSCYIRNNTGGAFTPNLRIDTPSVLNNFASTTNRLNQALQSCPNGAWTRVYHVFDPSAYTNIALGAAVVLRIPSGSLDSGAKSVNFAQFSLKPALALPTFVPPDPIIELVRSQRYYQKSFPQATAPAQNSGAVAGALSTRVTTGGTAGISTIAQPFAVVMRSAPTMTSYNPSAANANWRDASASIDCSGTNGFAQIGDRGFEAWTSQVAGNLITDLIYVHYTANAEL